MEVVTKTTTRYKCGLCGELWGTEADAATCESRPVSKDKGVNVGDFIRITTGEGQGPATVTQVYVIKKTWGHYAWKRYWHTIGLVADCESGGTRPLTFDDYDVI